MPNKNKICGFENEEHLNEFNDCMAGHARLHLTRVNLKTMLAPMQKEIKSPAPIYRNTKSIDRKATAKRLVAFRKAHRVSAVEVAKILKTPMGRKMSRSSMNYFESGSGDLPPEFCAAYEAAVLKVVGKPATN